MTGTTSTATVSAPASFAWPLGFDRIPDQDWVHDPVDAFGLSYDSVGAHGWYKNLEPLVSQALSALAEDEILVDYSSGTGLLTKRILSNINYSVGVVDVDPSAKFLRVALENFRDDPRVAFRLLEWLKQDRRLQTVDEVVGADLIDRGARVLTSANAIHLYSNLEETLDSWARIMRPGGTVLVCSANLRDPAARPGDWIIDETVAKVNEIAAEIVSREPLFEDYRETLGDGERMKAHAKLRDKVFVPVRPIGSYLDAFEDAGFTVLHTFNTTISAGVREWSEFLKTYDEGVLSWVGGSPKVEGQPPSETALKHRRFLIGYCLETLFAGRESFPANWTYITCRRR